MKNIAFVHSMFPPTPWAAPTFIGGGYVPDGGCFLILYELVVLQACPHRLVGDQVVHGEEGTGLL
jgi:hypothetical protein